MPNSAMPYTVMTHVDGSQDELLDVPDVGRADEPKSDIVADQGKGLDVAPTGQIGSLIQASSGLCVHLSTPRSGDVEGAPDASN
ncbi:hypothetical protein QFZ33_002282 [Arthrobacter globiformis]|nr:hypothetical protein [Arthrobacter globiformis]